jgi:hypothetical protein
MQDAGPWMGCGWLGVGAGCGQSGHGLQAKEIMKVKEVTWMDLEMMRESAP